MAVYRYKAQGPDIVKLTKQLPDVPTLTSYGPGVYVDITVATTSKADLDEQMLALGYAFDSTGPATTAAQAATATINLAVAGTSDGLLSAADKTKLDGIASGATATPLSSTAPADVTKAAAAVGVGTTAARADHKHDISTAVVGAVTVGAAAAEGTATSLARSDHVHSITAPAAPVAVDKSAASTGSSTSPARADHKHDITTAVVGSVTIGATAAEGTAVSVARSDHVHSLAAPAAPQAVGTAAATGTGTAAAREDHVHALTFAVANSVLATANAAISVNSQQITNLLAPTNPTDAANKAYVDGVATGMDWKASVRAATVAALPSVTYANGTAGVGATLTATANGALPAQDTSVTLVANDRLLVKNQVAGLQNGIYVVTQVGTGGTPFILTRSTDADQAAEVTTGLAAFVEEGSTLGATGWLMTTANPITIGTTALSFTQFNGSGSYVGGNGLVLTGNVFDVVANADGSIVSNANDIQVGILATDAQHGTRGGGTIHAAATTGVNGFMSSTDKTKLNDTSRCLISWGNDNVSATTTTRYLSPGYGDATARTTEISFRAPKAGTLRNMYVHVNGTAGNGNNIVYTIRINAVNSALTVTLASTAADGNDTTHTAAVAQGDLLSVSVTKATSVVTTPTDILVTCDLQQ